MVFCMGAYFHGCLLSPIFGEKGMGMSPWPACVGMVWPNEQMYSTSWYVYHDVLVHHG